MVNDSGNVDMTRVFPFLGKTELEVLSVVGSFLLVVTHVVTAYSTKEKVVASTKCVRTVGLCLYIILNNLQTKRERSLERIQGDLDQRQDTAKCHKTNCKYA